MEQEKKKELVDAANAMSETAKKTVAYVNATIPLTTAVKKKIAIIGVAAVLLAICLAVCGKGKTDGYYVMEIGNKNYGLIIAGNEATYTTNNPNYSDVTYGTVEKATEGVDLYFEYDGTFLKTNLSDFNPLHAIISNDGEHLYLSSDSSNWNTDTYRKVSKKEYEEYCKEHFE